MLADTTTGWIDQYLNRVVDQLSSYTCSRWRQSYRVNEIAVLYTDLGTSSTLSVIQWLIRNIYHALPTMGLTLSSSGWQKLAENRGGEGKATLKPQAIKVERTATPPLDPASM
jgi:hypothetical protein